MSSSTSKPLVLVTGGSGFLGMFCILTLLKANYHVRTTIRSPSRQKDVTSTLEKSSHLDPSLLKNLTFTIADLLKDAGWDDAVKDCTYVLHVASPFPAAPPKHEDDLIKPAVEGTLRVLRAAKRAGTIKRVVVTSSFAAIGYGQPDTKGKIYDETCWTPTDGSSARVGAYHKSKTLAERAAWDFIEKECTGPGKGGMELSVVNPVGIFGPVLGSDFATSIVLVQRLLNGSMPGCPDIEFGIIDVRDVADLHVLAMTHPKAKGERFLAVAPPCMSVREIAISLRKTMSEAANKAPTRVLPSFVLRIIAWWDPAVALMVGELGVRKELSNQKAERVLGWRPRFSNEEACKATGESLVKLGLV